jgi:hypothetical protein
MVDDGANRKNAQKMVDQFVTSGQSETAAYNKARQIEDSKLRKEVEATDNKKYIWIGVGVVALLGIIYIVTKKK